VTDTLLRTANEAGQDQASQALASFEADAASNPNSLNKLGDLAKLYESGNEAVAYQASDSIADKLSTGADPTTALAETSISDSASLTTAMEGEAAGGTGELGTAALDGGTTIAGAGATDGTTEGAATGGAALDGGTPSTDTDTGDDLSDDSSDDDDGGGDFAISADDEGGDDSDDDAGDSDDSDDSSGDDGGGGSEEG
jgi:hypothetical protein